MRNGTRSKSPGQTIHVWLDLTYYDGLWTFARGCKTGDAPVVWCGEDLPTVEATYGR